MDYKNKTAVVTGASSGLGVEYAKELAVRGCNLVLVARRKETLDAVALEIGKHSKVKIQTVALDLATPSSAKRLMAELGKLKLEPQILINNAGFGTSGRFTKDNGERVQEEIQLNVGTLVDLTHAMLPAMISAKFGAIVNIASTAAYQPVPGMAVYAATKAFVLSFTSAVWGETKGTGVKVLAVSPGATATNFFNVAGAKPSGELAPISDVIKTTFKALDSKNSGPSVIVGGRNAVMAAISKMMPKKLVIGVAAGMFLKD